MDRADLMKEWERLFRAWEETDDVMESIRLDAKMDRIMDTIIEKYGF